MRMSDGDQMILEWFFSFWHKGSVCELNTVWENSQLGLLKYYRESNLKLCVAFELL